MRFDSDNARPRSLLLGAAVLSLLAACDQSAPDGPLPTMAVAVYPLEADAGFVEVPSNQAFLAPARIFYSFHPADEDPHDAPLVVLVNGGPGAATSGGLLAHGTGPFVVDTAASEPTEPGPNPGSWTRFANLLYLDPRTAGWSHELDASACSFSELDMVVQDAGELLRVVLEIMDRHPTLVRAPVVLAGESYGGTRVTLMAHMLQHYAQYTTEDTALPWLRDRVQAHVDLAFGDLGGGEAAPERMAEQFGHLVFIQANLAGSHQFGLERELVRTDRILATAPDDADSYDVRRTVDEAENAVELTSAAMMDPVAFERLVGVAPGEVDGLPAVFVPYADPCGFSYLGGTWTLTALSEVTETTSLFITRARYDKVVYSDIFPTLYEEVGWTASVDEATATLHLSREGRTATIPFPKYDAGHEVAETAGVALRDDVRAWLVEEGMLD